MAAAKTSPSLTELAARIDAHLKRLEADATVNRYGDERDTRGLRPFYSAGAYPGGRFVMVAYVSYQGASSLTRDEAIRYLEYLADGGTARHWSVLR
jgi:hypothetical protein